MIEYEDNCVGCPKEMGCLGDTCPKRHEKSIYCDHCGCDLQNEYIEYDGGEYCEECFEEIVGARRVKI